MTDVSDPVPDLDEYLRQFEAYRNELNQIGFILTGSITKRFMRCGTVGCRCKTDPKALHGPYYEWTRKVRGKTVSVRLKKKDGELKGRNIDGIDFTDFSNEINDNNESELAINPDTEVLTRDKEGLVFLVLSYSL